MTREEIENIPKNVNTLLGLSVTMHTRQKLDEKLNEVCDLAIKALEQEPKTDLLNRIVSEIEACRETEEPNLCDYRYHRNEGLEMAIGIIDKYRQEPKTGVLDKIRAEISDYGSLWVDYKINGHSDRDIERIVEYVLRQAKKQVLDVIDKYRVSESDE